MQADGGCIVAFRTIATIGCTSRTTAILSAAAAIQSIERVCKNNFPLVCHILAVLGYHKPLKAFCFQKPSRPFLRIL